MKGIVLKKKLQKQNLKWIEIKSWQQQLQQHQQINDEKCIYLNERIVLNE